MNYNFHEVITITIEEILNGNYKVTEKIKLLNDFEKEINQRVEQVKNEVIKEYKYCPICKEYYRDKTWEEFEKTEIRQVCTFHSLAEFDDDTYEDKECRIKCSMCPMGHIVEEEVSW